MFIWTVIFILCATLKFSTPSDILQFKVGYLFEKDNEENDLAFNIALSRTIFSSSQRKINYDSPHEVLDQTCDLLEEGITAIFGPSTKENSEIVKSITDVKDVPHLETRWDNSLDKGSFTLNLHPHPTVLSMAYNDLIHASDWKSFTILYENNDGLSLISDLFNMDHGFLVTLKQLDKYNTGDYRPILKESWRSGETNFLLHCSIEHLEDVLIQAQQIGLMTNVHNYIITNLDMQTINLEPYKYSETNITGVRLVDPGNTAVVNFVTDMYREQKGNVNELNYQIEEAAMSLQCETALLVDAINLFVLAINEVVIDEIPALYCNRTDSLQYGTSVMNYMKTNVIDGLTGHIKFDHDGFRTEFNLDVIELTEDGVNKIATWNISEGLKLYKVATEQPLTDDSSLENKTFVVITALTDPYGMLTESQMSLKGNERFEGFGIDLIHELSLMEKFNYTFIIREDKSNGNYDTKTKKWSGMIGDLMDHKADLAITDLTITSEREQAVDFTNPFMNLGISIVYKKPSKAPPNFFSFAEPFAVEVWLWLAGAYFIVSISLFIMGRLCPSEWTNPYPCIENPEFLINQFSLRNSFWFTIGSLMQQGTEIAPIAYATRMVAGLWWFFTLIMVSSYTANLAAFLATESPDSPFTNVYELQARAEKAGIKYGAKKNGATANFFRDSTIEEYKKIYNYMMENEDEVMMKENKDGVERAEKEPYAFFMESTSIEYEIQRHCNLTQIGDMLDEKGYGIAMRKNSTYRHRLSTAVLKLQESGKIADLKRKWWEERRGGGQCMGEAESQEAKPLNLKNVGGVFWVTVGGIALATVFVFIEMVLHILKQSIKYKAPMGEELKEEIKFYFKFKGLVKPVRIRKSDSKSPIDSEKSTRDSPAPYGFLPDVTKDNL